MIANNLKELTVEAAKHEENAGIICGSMSSKPTPDDFRLAELMQLELDRATDKRALVNHLVNERIKELQTYFEQQTGCTVHHEWKIDLQHHRFYFESTTGREWQYILDVHQDDVDEHAVEEIIQQLNAANWLQLLASYAGKLVPSFKDGQFSVPATFQKWPEKS